MKKKYLILIGSLIVVAMLIFMVIPQRPCTPLVREIAITMDDLPFQSALYQNPEIPDDAMALFERIVHSLLKHHAPATGFVIADRVNAAQFKILVQFREKGFDVGSHTYSHLNLRRTSADVYIDDLDRADKVLAPLMPGPKYFRYPYLAYGHWNTKQKVFDYLAQHRYIIAPVTIDSRDFEFNLELFTSKERDKKQFLTDLKQRYLDYVWHATLAAEKKDRCASVKQILMLHANMLNGLFLDDLLQMFENHGYHFVTLGEALKPS